MRVEDLPDTIREQITYDQSDYAISRPRLRTASRVIDEQAVRLLHEFREPTTIVDAILRYSDAHNLDPQQVLEGAFPLIEQFVNEHFLVYANTQEADEITASFNDGDHIASFEIVHCVQVLEDTELYCARQISGTFVALKIVRPGAAEAAQTLKREATLLQFLDGSVSPSFVAIGTWETFHYLAMEWCPGVVSTAAAATARQQPAASGRRRLLRLCQAIADAYTHLHAQGVIHGDIHPRNLLIDDAGGVRLIDFGIARVPTHSKEFGEPLRGGIGFFMEPEYAEARLHYQKIARATPAGEQYSLASLLYLLVTGKYYLDFSLEKQEIYRQILEEEMLPFAQRDEAPWPELEQVLRRALQKRPSERFSSLAAFAEHLHAIPEPTDAASMLLPATPPVQVDAMAFLDMVLQRLSLTGPLHATGFTTSPHCSVNYGMAGAAYALYRIACVHEDPATLALADMWSVRAIQMKGHPDAFLNTQMGITPQTVGTNSLYHTAVGLHCVEALIARARGDVVSHQAAIDAFITISVEQCDNLDLTLGQSGLLLGCALLLDAAPQSHFIDTSHLITHGNAVLEAIWGVIEGYPPVKQCVAFPYLGMAHGWAGVLYATLCWCQTTGRALPITFAQRLHELQMCAEPDQHGLRWRRQIVNSGREHSEYFPSWCNGTAGFVYLWTLAHQNLGERSYLELAEAAALSIWEDTDQMGNLCCGLVGRAYALLNYYKQSGAALWHDRAWELTRRALAGWERPESWRDSLYKGDTGLAVLIADLQRPEWSAMPLFELEGWSDRTRLVEATTANLVQIA
jgi:serine/threonine-protein kinase